MGELNKEVVDIVWERPGSNRMSASIFRRWTQGLIFRGPCTVIAPVQAFLLKNILFNRESSNWRHITEEEQKAALCSTLAEILEQACSTSSTTSYCLVTWAKGQSPHTNTHTPLTGGPETSQNLQDQQPTALSAEDLGFERFHSILQKRIVKSLSELREEVSLVNLLVTGHAVSNVWDGDRDCSCMKLHGIHNQASVGFLSLMESLRYCKVGAFLKSPKFPIWILGSETHLSVFFAKEMCLVAPESPSEQARRVFQTFDPEDNGFIPDSLLEEVMKALDLVSEPEYYVNLMKSTLDPEGLGIVLLAPFLLEFFPDQDTGIPDSFPVYHYNGLKQSNHNERVEYVQGTALVLGFEDPMVRTDDTPVKRCLQTKWPYIELLWTTERSPSLN
ncbi:unnamed protein product [Coregonus sp. 'balchen']|nr:unnamed protein product [Coregonus sp. 'balchen']